MPFIENLVAPSKDITCGIPNQESFDLGWVNICATDTAPELCRAFPNGNCAAEPFGEYKVMGI